MQHLKKIIPYIFLVILILTQSCKSNKDVIGEEEFSVILSEMYLADQFIESHQQFRAQADTMQVYSAIFKKYGYTSAEYEKSVQYYLQRGDLYKTVNQKAREILVHKNNKLKQLLDLKRGVLNSWWATDTIRTLTIEQLYQNPYLRSVKWIVVPRDTIIWQMKDSILTDIPHNITWWNNNMDFIFNDSVIKKISNIQLIINEKDSSKLHIPDIRKANKKRLRTIK
jgi:Domain of unknown function (DUF4296)